MNSLCTISGHGFRQKSIGVPVVTTPLDKISTTGYNSCRGAYGIRLLNVNYTGATLTLIAYGGTGATSDFYADKNGILTTGYNGTGTTLSSWLTTQGGSTTVAYCSVLYDQSVTTSNNGTQVTLSNAPTYDVANKLLNLGNKTTATPASINNYCWFNLPDATIPYNDSSYTLICRHNVFAGYDYGSFISGGASAVRQLNAIDGYTDGYMTTWYGDDNNITQVGSRGQSNVLSSLYTSGGTRYAYVNGVQSSLAWVGSRSQPSTGNFLGKNISGNASAMRSQMYYWYIFSTSLTDADRIILEAT